MIFWSTPEKSPNPTAQVCQSAVLMNFALSGARRAISAYLQKQRRSQPCRCTPQKQNQNTALRFSCRTNFGNKHARRAVYLLIWKHDDFSGLILFTQFDGFVSAAAAFCTCFHTYLAWVLHKLAHTPQRRVNKYQNKRLVKGKCLQGLLANTHTLCERASERMSRARVYI